MDLECSIAPFSHTLNPFDTIGVDTVTPLGPYLVSGDPKSHFYPRNEVSERQKSSVALKKWLVFLCTPPK